MTTKQYIKLTKLKLIENADFDKSGKLLSANDVLEILDNILNTLKPTEAHKRAYAKYLSKKREKINKYQKSRRKKYYKNANLLSEEQYKDAKIKFDILLDEIKNNNFSNYKEFNEIHKKIKKYEASK
jgi:hypothetical protein